ncbi:hypothetical protein BDV11DRAFT_210663 [Aspergillus similis]
MPGGRPSINLEPYKNEITRLYLNNTVPNRIAEYLADSHGISATPRTIEARLRKWGIRKSNRTASTDKVLQARIMILFYQVRLEEKELLKVLNLDGFKVGASTLKYLRHKLGLLRHTTSPMASQAQVEALLSKFRMEHKDGQIEGHGKTFLHHHFRSQGLFVARDRLYSPYHELAPTTVQRRLSDLQRNHGAYIVPGPNFIWSIDGYLKLASYGFEIYAAVDAYSRYIIWVYVGSSSRTAVSVLRQFLDALQVTKQQPCFVRSDRRTETILLAEAQHKLQQSKHPEIQLSDCSVYGTSAANQRVEAWWVQLSRGLLSRWRNFFQALQDEGAFSKDNLADQIALYAVYMPILQLEINSFVRTWNNHSIRKQKSMPSSVPGKPFMNYYYPPEGISNHGLEFDTDKFHVLHNDVQNWNSDEYLPQSTYDWTLVQLKELGFDPHSPPEDVGDDILTPYRTIYSNLRARIQVHIQDGSQPELSLLERPVGGFDWDPMYAHEIPEVELEYDQEESERGNSGETR